MYKEVNVGLVTVQIPDTCTKRRKRMHLREPTGDDKAQTFEEWENVRIRSHEPRQQSQYTSSIYAVTLFPV